MGTGLFLYPNIMTEFDKSIQNKQSQVAMLLRRYRVVGPPTSATVLNAARIHGPAFQQKLVRELAGPGVSNFGGSESDPNFIGPPQDTSGIQGTSTTGGGGKALQIWNTILGVVGSTGQTVADFRNNIGANGNQPQVVNYEVPAKKNYTLYIVGIIAVIIVLVVWYLKKK